MPRRPSPMSRMYAYQMLVYRDGEACARCGTTPSELPKGEVLELDHVDQNKYNAEPVNLRLLCKSCNLAVRNTALAGLLGVNDPKESRIVTLMQETETDTKIAAGQA